MRRLRPMADRQHDAHPSSLPAALSLAACTVFVLFGSAQALMVGSMELQPCRNASALCGKLDRPLDPTGAVAGRISIDFEYYPHTGREQPLGTLVATEGG